MLRIKIKDLEFEIHYKDIRHIYFYWIGTQHFKVHIPIGKSLSELEEILFKEYDRLKKACKRKEKKICNLDDDTLFYIGEKFLVARHLIGRQKNVCFEKNILQRELHLYLPHLANRLGIEKTLIAKFYYQEGKRVYEELCKKWVVKMGIKESFRIEIKKVKSFYGRYTPRKKNLCFNLYLIAYPFSCIELIVVHELCHYFEPNHSRRFYALMEQFLPNWKEREQELKKYDLIPSS